MAADKLEPFLDVEKAIHEWGMLSCERSARTRKQKKMFKRQFVNEEIVMDVQIDWSHLSTSNRTDWGKTCGDGDLPSNTKATDVNVLFQTDYKNDTDHEQQYTLKIEKTTNSSCTTEIEHGVTNGIELSASLSVGDFLEAGAGFSHEEELHKMEGETIERQLTWAAESNITVLPHRRATAEMQVIEKQQSGDFTVFTTMTGYVIVKYISLKDSSLVFGHSAKIDTIVKDYIKEMKKRQKVFVGVDASKDSKVEFQTKGKCNFKYGIKQVVTIEQDPKDTKPRK